MKYSDRILKTTELLIPGFCLADIGCDHGYMSILAARKGLFEKIYAADVRKDPLQKAQENIVSCGLEDKISTFLSDGFKNIPPDADSAVICGMGGLLIKKILTETPPSFPLFRQMILGPHSEAGDLRAWILSGTNYCIFRETVLKDAGKYYVLMDVRPDGTGPVSSCNADREPAFITYGSPYVQTDPELYRAHLIFLLQKNKKILSGIKQNGSRAGEQRYSELEEEIRRLQLLLTLQF